MKTYRGPDGRLYATEDAEPSFLNGIGEWIFAFAFSIILVAIGWHALYALGIIGKLAALPHLSDVPPELPRQRRSDNDAKPEIVRVKEAIVTPAAKHGDTGAVVILLPENIRERTLAYLNRLHPALAFRAPTPGETPDVRVTWRAPAQMNNGSAWGLAYIGGNEAFISTDILTAPWKYQELGRVIVHELLHCGGLDHDQIPLNQLHRVQLLALKGLSRNVDNNSQRAIGRIVAN